MRNFQGIIFIWIQIYGEIFKSGKLKHVLQRKNSTKSSKFFIRSLSAVWGLGPIRNAISFKTKAFDLWIRFWFGIRREAKQKSGLRLLNQVLAAHGKKNCPRRHIYIESMGNPTCKFKERIPKVQMTRTIIL